MVPVGLVPFFWTRHYNKSLQYVGQASEFDTVHIDGDLGPEGKWLALYAKNDKILAAAGMGRSTDVLTVLEALKQNQMPPLSAIKSGQETPASIRDKLKQRRGQSGCSREKCCHKQ